MLALDSAAVLFATGFTHTAEADLGVRQSTAGQRIGPTIRFVAMNRDGDRYHFNLTGRNPFDKSKTPRAEERFERTIVAASHIAINASHQIRITECKLINKMKTYSIYYLN